MSEPALHPATLDVSALPENVFGNRSVVWWATTAFMAIEGTTLAVCAVTYLYLRRNFATLPPERLVPPALGVASAEVALMLVSFLAIHRLDRAGAEKRLPAIRVWLLVALAFNLAFVVLRWFELPALHVRWDQNAYGSSAWLILLVHGTLLAAEVGEIALFALMAWTGHWEEKHYSDTCDLAFYWYFMVLSWLPLYAIVYLLPRVM
jgi:heme/copper-type cytochrome/quinol oxidase subunit 3